MPGERAEEEYCKKRERVNGRACYLSFYWSVSADGICGPKFSSIARALVRLDGVCRLWKMIIKRVGLVTKNLSNEQNRCGQNCREHDG